MRHVRIEKGESRKLKKERNDVIMKGMSHYKKTDMSHHEHESSLKGVIT